MSISMELRAQRVGQLELSDFCQVESGTAIRDVVTRMREMAVNVALITREGKLVGILSDRDVLKKVASFPAIWDKPVNEIMTHDPITIDLEASAADALWLMNEKQVRSLPTVTFWGDVVGNMTPRTIVRYLSGRYPIEVLNLPPRPNQYPDQVEGG